jgi:P4 family phage/plasmid primase-like protien
VDAEEIFGGRKGRKRRSGTGGQEDDRTKKFRSEDDESTAGDGSSEDEPAAAEAAVAAAERAETILWVRGQFANAGPIQGTPGERYLVDHRGLKTGPWPEALRWNPAYQWQRGATPVPCLLAAVTNAAGDIVAVQSIEIDSATGAKSTRTDKPKMSRGPVSEGFVHLGDSSEVPSVLAVGEGVETSLTRYQMAPCDAYACLGAIRFVPPQPYHRRVDILADTNARTECRRLALRYTRLGRMVYVITVPDALGLKADLNDAMQQLGEAAVAMAIEDAERFTLTPSPKLSDFELQIGSDVEIGRQIIDKLEEIYGPIIVVEGRMWRFDRTHWTALDDDHLVRFVHRADGAVYPSGDGVAIVRLSKSRVASIIDAAMKYRHQPNFFDDQPLGINCETGFIRFNQSGEAALHPHARQWRHRHVVRGRWPIAEVPQNSLFRKYLKDAVAPDWREVGQDAEAIRLAKEDAKLKTKLLGEVAGCVALGRGTRVRDPKAVVPYSQWSKTGKSTFLHLLRSLPNPEAVASVAPSKFGDEKYTYRLIGKTLNASDELPSNRALKSDVFKRLITGEPVPARNVYCPATDFIPTALHVFSGNVLPSFAGGMDQAVLNRLLPIPFDHVVPPEQLYPRLDEKILQDEADIFLDFAVEGARRLIQQGGFTIPGSSEKQLEQWASEADPVRGFAKECVEITEDPSIVSVARLYRAFVAWAGEAGHKREFLPSARSFGRHFRAVDSRFIYDRANGSIYRNLRIVWEPQ